MSVVWPSASKSIQSRATAISGRLPTMKGTQYASRVSTSIPWLDSRRSTCLLAYLVFSPRASARPWPISATASEPDWIAPSVAPARERMRWACRQSSNRLFSTRWMPSNEICWLADKARPPLSEQEGSNPTFRILAIQSRRHQPACARPFALMLFVSPKLLTRASLLIRPRIQMRGAMRAAPEIDDLSALLDDAKCFALVRQHRWPEGVCCPACGSGSVVRDGFDGTQPRRQRYRCEACAGRFDDLTGTVLAGHHQPLRVWVLCLYFMGLNLLNRQIA